MQLRGSNVLHPRCQERGESSVKRSSFCRERPQLKLDAAQREKLEQLEHVPALHRLEIDQSRVEVCGGKCDPFLNGLKGGK